MSARHCWTCKNVLCRYYKQRDHSAMMSDFNGKCMVSPASFTMEFGCEKWVGE